MVIVTAQNALTSVHRNRPCRRHNVSSRARSDQGVPAAAELHAWVFRCKVHEQEIVIYRVHLLTHLYKFLFGHI
eukprot:scaffold67395_cov87-Phaeocystis_antarctica.AAC.1